MSKPKNIEDRATELRKQCEAVRAELNERMDAIRPAIEEAKFLDDMLRVIDIAKAKRKPLPRPKRQEVPWQTIRNWFLNNYMPTDSYKIKDMMIEFDKPKSWAVERTQRLVQEGFLEHWGNGLLRRPAINEGRETRVHVGNQTDVSPAIG